MYLLKILTTNGENVMKTKLCAFAILLVTSAFSHASELIITNNKRTYIATENTTLPYNLLFVDFKTGNLCFRGRPQKIEGIIERMIDNHSVTDDKLTLFQINNKQDKIRFNLSNKEESHNDRSRPHDFYIKKCYL
jgi:hypothetical protein